MKEKIVTFTVLASAVLAGCAAQQGVEPSKTVPQAEVDAALSESMPSQESLGNASPSETELLSPPVPQETVQQPSVDSEPTAPKNPESTSEAQSVVAPTVVLQPSGLSAAEVDAAIDEKLEPRVEGFSQKLSEVRDTLDERTKTHEERLESLKAASDRLTAEAEALGTSVGELREVLADMQKGREQDAAALATLSTRLESIASDRQKLAEDVRTARAELDKTSRRLDALESTVTKETSRIAELEGTLSNQALILKGLLAFLAVLTIAVLYLLRKLGVTAREVKRLSGEHDAMKGKLAELNEGIVKADGALLELIEKLSEQKPAAVEKAAEPDHSLALKVADEIVRIELNVSRMDPNTKGLKQISRAVKRIKDNFLANGYEIVDMLGMPYNEGMKLIANFLQDDNLEPGAQIITGVAKPQINFNGKMIQAAQVTVSQNI